MRQEPGSAKRDARFRKRGWEVPGMGLGPPVAMLRRALCSLALCSLAAGPGAAQPRPGETAPGEPGRGDPASGDPSVAAWPTRPLRLIVPFPPGGSTDILARILAERLGNRLGQTVVVENRGGAAGNIAAEAATRAEPDGYTLFFASVGTAAINRHLYGRLTWRAEDLVPVVLWADLPNAVVVGAASEIRSLAELIAAARARPGELSFASSGNGTTLHLSGELFKAMTGTDILHVPFRGGADSVNQLMGGRIDVAFNNLPTALPLIRGGQLRVLAVTSPERSPALPEVATVAELGLPGYAAVSWFGVQVPRQTPEALVRRLNAEVNAILADGVTRPRIEATGARALGGSMAGFTAFIESENVKWAAVIRQSGAKVD